MRCQMKDEDIRDIINIFDVYVTDIGEIDG